MSEKKKPTKRGPSRKGSLDRDFLRAVLTLGGKRDVRHVLLVSDVPLLPEDLRGRSVRRKLIFAVTSEVAAEQMRAAELPVVVIPPYEYARVERIKVAVLAALSAGLVSEGDVVLAATGKTGGYDTLLRLEVGFGLEDRVSLDALQLSQEFSSQVVEALIDLALRIGHNGFEGHPVGTIICVGDATTVMEKSTQLTINPFQGISEGERNILDPKIRGAVEAFSVLDGAFVVREDGVVMAAGRYLQPSTEEVKVPMGLGTRHASAAAISRETEAIAITVSQTSGDVRVFRNGEIVLELHQSGRRTH
ncbi:MAG: hypothetical protein D6729_08955 [Deltaproteobacteria bacterium]|nr:MAG: hypothetical protein D6729_08955 [Deltaproteobacteria bacterium]